MEKRMIRLLISLLFCAICPLSFAAQNAIVDANFAGKPGTIIDGIPHFSLIQQALATVPETNSEPFVIQIKDGRYFEKLQVDKANVQFVGESMDGTIISFDANAETPDPTGGNSGTPGSYTLQIAAPDFRAENLTIENSFDYPANAAKPDNDPSKIQNAQAVALMTAEGSDRAVFCNCIIRGFQDTLFADAGRHYFHNCRILGHVDFIFGAGQAVFERCDIVSRNRNGKNPTGYISAPSTPISFPFGFLFLHSRLQKETPELPAGSVRLGRPWHPGANPKVEGSAVFIQCFMGDHIGPEGYARISARDSSGQRIWFEVQPDSRFFEYGSIGPGARISPARPVLDKRAMAWYTAENVLNGWQPECPEPAF